MHMNPKNVISNDFSHEISKNGSNDRWDYLWCVFDLNFTLISWKLCFPGKVECPVLWHKNFVLQSHKLTLLRAGGCYSSFRGEFSMQFHIAYLENAHVRSVPVIHVGRMFTWNTFSHPCWLVIFTITLLKYSSSHTLSVKCGCFTGTFTTDAARLHSSHAESAAREGGSEY